MFEVNNRKLKVKWQIKIKNPEFIYLISLIWGNKIKKIRKKKKKKKKKKKNFLLKKIKKK